MVILSEKHHEGNKAIVFKAFVLFISSFAFSPLQSSYNVAQITVNLPYKAKKQICLLVDNADCGGTFNIL